MAISKRDTNILYTIMGCLVVYVLWAFGVDPLVTQYTDLNDDLTKQQEQYEKNQKILSDARKIEEGYKRVEAQFPADVPDKDPADVFSEEVTSLVTQTVGKQPEIQVTTREPVKGAKGYEMLIFPFTVKGADLKPVAELLKAFDQRGYLVRNATIQRNQNLDKSDLTIDITLARIVKPEEEVPEEGRAKPGLRIGGRVRG